MCLSRVRSSTSKRRLVLTRSHVHNLAWSAKCENSHFDEPGFRRAAPGNESAEQWRQGGPQKERKWAKSGTELKSVARPLKNGLTCPLENNYRPIFEFVFANTDLGWSPLYTVL